MSNYINYHKHSHYTAGIGMVDCNVKPIDYAERIIELKGNTLFTTEHGYGGDIFNYKTVADEYGLHCKFGVEGYIVPNPLEKDNRNYHIILIPKTNVARKKLNLASSRANIEGYYYRPRFFIEDLINNFDKGELFITTACIAGLLHDDDSINEILLPLYKKHGEYVYLEVQSHNADIQKETNQKAIKLADELNLNLIAATDSHYIYPNQASERTELLKGKGISYGDEDEFILDYPSADELYERFKMQGVLSESQIKSAIENTNVFEECEDIYLDKEVKMPTIYGNLTEDEKIDLLKQQVNEGFKKVMEEDEIPKDKWADYIDNIRKEMQVIIDTQEVHSSDYFLLNKAIVDKAINDYNGVLTRTGRGSCGAYLINKILGITQIDRLSIDLPIYSERFMSTARLIENKSMPDIDFNINKQEPFVRATRDLLGKHQCYPMVAYGTMQLSEAFRNVCRSEKLEYSEVNEVAKQLDRYRDDVYWGKYIKEAEKYVGTITSTSVHPCSHLVANFDIREEIGVIRVGDFICVPMTSTEADEWKYLKEDFLIVTVWDIISKTFELIGEPIISLHDLLKVTKDDKRIWDIFKNGYTCTLNQFDTDTSTAYTKIFKPDNIEECAMMVSAIRPAFDNFRDDFLHRREYTTGSKHLDELFSQTHHFILFQECLMKFFEWLGISPSESIGLIKKISKKKIKQKDFDNLKETMKNQWIINTGSVDKFDKIWDDIQATIKYSFNSPHGYATACDALYGAYLKVNYPIEYYTVVLNQYSDKEAKTNRLIEELKHFGVKCDTNLRFRNSSSDYTYNKEKNTIYKGLSSIKSIGADCANNLYTLKDTHFNSFTELLYYIKSHSLANRTEIEILIKINFFEEFGEISLLLKMFMLFYTKDLYKRKTFKKNELNDEFTYGILKAFSEKETEKQFSGVNMEGVLEYIELHTKPQKVSLMQHMSYEVELLGYTDLTDPNADDDIYIVSDTDYNKYGTPFVSLYSVRDGSITQYKCVRKWFREHEVNKGDVLRVCIAEQYKRKQVGKQWVQSDETEIVIKNYVKMEVK